MKELSSRASSVRTPLKNKFRGMVSAFKSQKFVKDKSGQPTAELRRNIKSLLLEARALIPPDHYREFIAWIDKQTKYQLKDYTNSKIGYEELQGICTEAIPVELNKELLWLSHRISNEKFKLNLFIKLANEIEKNVFIGQYELALMLISKLEKTQGVSFWTIQLKIALIHVSKGLESQKIFTAKVRKIYKSGLLGYITYYSSVRNEDRTTLNKFKDDLNLRITNHKYFSEEVKKYVFYRLSGDIPKNTSDLGNILQIEQNNSIIDVYDTYIRILQNLAKNLSSLSIRNILVSCLNILIGVEDYRLNKLRVLLSIKLDTRVPLPSRQTCVSDALIEGRIYDALRGFRREVRQCTSIDPWQFIYASFVYSNKERKDREFKARPHTISQSMGLVFRDEKSAVDNLDQVVKLSTNFIGLKGFTALLDFVSIFRREKPDKSWAFETIGLNSSTIGIEDFSLRSNSKNYLTHNIKKSITFLTWNNKTLTTATNKSHSVASAMIASIGELEKERYENALKVLNKTNNMFSFQPYKMFWYAMKLHALYCLGQQMQVVELIASSVTLDNSLNSILPIKSSLNEYTYFDFLQCSNPLSAPITLYMLWQRTESAETLSYTRTATRKALKDLCVTKPSELTRLTKDVSINEQVYFMSKICVPQIIDIIRSIRSSKDVLLERQDICRTLIELDSINSKMYSLEILDIEEELQMNEGKRVVDGTRIYVDTDALYRWAIKEMFEDVARYNDLLDVNVDTVQNFDDVYRDFVESSDMSKKSFSPESEADAVLFEMVRKIGHEFLTNPTFGLDYYLSKRIRHQSFIGLIRSHYEFSHLITVRESNATDYDYNEFWVEKFKTLDKQRKDELNIALADFAGDFDDLLIDARDLKFQINSEEFPDGLISLEYPSILIILIKSILPIGVEVEKFVETLNSILWVILTGSLQRARNYVSNTLKVKLANNVDRLKANVKKCAGDDPAYVNFEMVLSEKSTKVQRSLDEVIAWFTPLDIADLNKIFSLKKIVDIAVDGVLSLHKAFKPVVTIELSNEEEIFLSSEALPLINDTFFILFDNVKVHSGIKKPKIDIFVETSMREETLSIVFVSESKAALRKGHESELSKITAIIKEKTLDARTKKEGHSGIIKLAATTQQSKNGDLKYGFNEDGNFEVNLTLFLHVYKKELAEVGCEED